MSLIGFDVPVDFEMSKTVKKVVNQDLISVEVEKVECVKNKTSSVVSFYCSIDKIAEAQMVLNYTISNSDYSYIYDFYRKEKSPKLAKNEGKAIMLIKNIIDSYDPIIQIATED